MDQVTSASKQVSTIAAAMTVETFVSFIYADETCVKEVYLKYFLLIIFSQYFFFNKKSSLMLLN